MSIIISVNDYVVQPSDQCNNLIDAVDLILDFNESIQLDLVWKYKNQRIKNQQVILIGKNSQNYWILHIIKKKIFFLCIYKKVNFTKEAFENNGIEVIKTLWLNEKHIEEKLGHKNLPVISNKYGKIYKKHRHELVDEPIEQPNRRFLHIDLALKIIMGCRTDESCSFKTNLGFKLHDVVNTIEQPVINSIKDAFEGEDMQTQYSVLGYRIDLYFHKYKLAIEVDELGHADRNINNEIERQKALEIELNCVFIRINSDEKDFNIFKPINEIYRHIKKSSKKSLIDKISKRLLE